MSFFKRVDGQFHLVEEKPHCCNSLLPTLKKTWFMSHIEAIVKGDLNITKADAKKQLKDNFAINVDEVRLGRYLSLGKSDYFLKGLSFGLIENYLQVVSTLNEGTATNLCTDGDQFKRAFLFPRMCIDAFLNSTKVCGLDACHIKAKYGGVLLVLTVLDGDGHVFPAAI